MAVAFTKRDPIRTHARDELGIDIDELANPLQVLTATARAQYVCLLSDCIPILVCCLAVRCSCVRGSPVQPVRSSQQ